uniref:Ribosomal protein S2 n=1 Tax=Pandorina colemaniae TaxID=47786 RepID=A0A6C0RWY5_9CHLO|nr:ribosomal protein S2 [Pandorina colemaniae]
MIKIEKKTQFSTLIPGNLIKLKITAVGTNNVGINELAYGIPILVPNAKLGDTVQVKILKVLTSKKIVIAKLVKILKSTSIKNPKLNLQLPSLTPGTSLDITINKLGPNATGIANLPNTYNNVTKLIIKKPLITIGEKLTVLVTRVKKGYAFAVIDILTTSPQQKSVFSKHLNKKSDSIKGSKYTIVLPKKAKRYLKHIVFKVSNKFQDKMAGKILWQNQPIFLKSLVSNTILFVKPSLSAKLGDKVQIQITKFIKLNDYNVAVAKIIRLNPISATQKKALVRASLRQMLRNGMHYGEKAIKCNARMKNFVWVRKKTTKFMYNNDQSQIKNIKSVISAQVQQETRIDKALTTETRPLIKKGRNIINLLKTRRCLNKALSQLTKYALKGKTFLFVGTKKAAAGLVSRAALFTKKAFFVNTRWLGGMLTNWKTILKSISKIRPILKEKQIIIKDILEKRHTIKTRLIQKALLLRKKSKLMLKKGKQLVQMLKMSSNMSEFFEKTNLLNTKRKEFVTKGILLLEKQRQLSGKQKELLLQSQTLKMKYTQLTNNYRQVLNNLMISRKKLRELKGLLIVSKELQLFKQQAKQDNKNLYMVSSIGPKVAVLAQNPTLTNLILANPPKDILNKMIALIKESRLVNKDIKTNNTNLNLKSLTSTKTLILTQLVSKFNLFVPTIKVKIKNLQTYILTQKTLLNKILGLLNNVKNKINLYLIFKNKIKSEFQKIKQNLQMLRNIMRVLRRKLKQISAQKRLLKFLPKLRYLPTPAYKIEQTARFLMKQFVDPKMKYPMDSIYDEKLSRQSKKVAASRKKKWQRLEKYLGGISNMTKIKEKQIRNNVAIIIGQQEEMNAVRECKKLGIKMFHIVDTNCNPGLADHFIPANDDARNSIKYILGKFLTRIRLAQKLKIHFKKIKTKKTKIKK